MSSTDNFGDRMKMYEALETESKFMPLLPIYARIDGQSFSKFTRGFRRPFDPDMSRWMIQTTAHLVKETGARIGYTQSDEISLVWLQEDLRSELWFARKKQKMVSSLAAEATSAFYNLLLDDERFDLMRKRPTFDARVFQLPNQVEASNVVLWREQDATKNAIGMAARSLYSQKELMRKNGNEMQEMMFQKGVNFNDYPAAFKRGTFLRRELYEIETENGSAIRSRIAELPMPKFGSVSNRTGVIFNNEEPVLIED